MDIPQISPKNISNSGSIDNTNMPNKKKNLLKLLIVILVLAGLFYFFVFRKINNIKSKGIAVKASATELKQAFLENNIDLINSQMKVLSKKYDIFQKEAKSIYWVSYIPVLGNYVKDFRNAIEAGDYFIQAGDLTVQSITPYADLIGFKKGQTSFAEKSAEDRLQTAIITLDKVLNNVDVISEKIAKAQKSLDQIDPKRYPEKLGKLEVRSQITNIKEQVNGISTLFVDAKPLLKKLPDIFGKDKQQMYLILFQNDKELRATGGFLTSYALFKVEKGKMRIERSDDIYTLDSSIASHPKAPKQILDFHKNVSQFYIRDSNLSPDFPESIKLFNSLYDKSTTKVKYDGIIAIDSKVLVDMLTIFGDTEADGIVFSAKTDKRCDCPQVLYSLFDLVDRPVNYIKTNRKGILGDLMYALFYKAIGFSPSKYWGTLTQEMFKNLNEKHILLYFNDPEIQNSIEKLNYGGLVRNSNSDYLYINDVNFAGAKANMFVSHDITSITKEVNGTVGREVSIRYKNPYPQSDCNLERGGLCLNAALRNWIRVYVPQGSKLIDFKGSAKKVNTYDELGKTVFEGFLIVNPMGFSDVKISYTLPNTIKLDSNYQLLIQKQPGTQDYKLKININGNKSFDGLLNVDTVAKLK